VASSNHPSQMVRSSRACALDGTALAVGKSSAGAAADRDARQDDFDLVQRLVAGDAGAWKSFVQRFQRLVLTRVLFAARELNQPLAHSDAEDFCAEVFSQLIADDYSVLRRFEGRSTLSTWLCVVTRRIVIRRLAAARREPSRPAAQSVRPLESLPSPAGENPLALLIGGEDRALLAAGMAQLGERQRQLARLFYIDGCSYREISRQLEMPINSIGPTLARIQEKLRAAMKQEE
jgi:RNA polymerase sigma-70 factor, ECF subfamily